jgi:hypothetical protein
VYPLRVAALDDEHVGLVRDEEVVVVGKDGHVTAVGGHGRLGALAGDGSGGVWIVASGGLAHWTPGHAPLDVDNEASRDTWTATAAWTPVALVPVPGGVVLADQHQLVEVHADAPTEPAWRVAIGEAGSRTHAIAIDRDELVAVATTADAMIVYRARRGTAVATSERVPLPHWWRDAHAKRFGDAHIATLLDDSGVWIATDDLAMRGENNTWRTYAMSGSPVDHAGRDTGSHAVASIAFDGGYTARSGEGRGGAFALRAEAIDAPNSWRPAIGIGGYAELATNPVGAWASSGITVVGYGSYDPVGRASPAIALSAGPAFRFDGTTQLELSLFAGYRERDLRSFEGPIGVRVTARVGATADVSVALSVDVIALATAVTAVIMVAHMH